LLTQRLIGGTDLGIIELIRDAKQYPCSIELVGSARKVSKGKFGGTHPPSVAAGFYARTGVVEHANTLGGAKRHAKVLQTLKDAVG
jgi:hypothetical protein